MIGAHITTIFDVQDHLTPALNRIADTAAGFLLSRIIERAFEGVADAIGKAVTVGIEFNATLESQNLAFKNLLGSQQAATAAMNQFLEVAIRNPATCQRWVVG
jgi:hypothetical protein